MNNSLLNNIVVYNTKGGVGKTSLSFSLSKDLKFKYITNDNSVSMLKMGKSRLQKQNIPLQENTLYDFGGFEDKEALNITNQAKLVIIPTICDMNSLARTIALIKKIKHRRIVVVGTMIETKKDINEIKQVINYHFPDIKVFQFRKNKLLKKAMEKGLSATNIFNLGNQEKRAYKNSFLEYNKILEKAKEVGNENFNNYVN